MLSGHGVGTACAAPKVITLGQSQTKKSEVTLAFNKSRFDTKRQEWVQQTAFVKTDAFGRLAVFFEEQVKQGTEVAVEGWMETESWEKDGQKQSRLVFHAYSARVVMPRPKNGNSNGNGNGDGNGNGPAGNGSPPPSDSPPPSNTGSTTDNSNDGPPSDADIPF